MRSSTTLMVDGHVHYHPCFGVARFLESARLNFDKARARIGRPEALGCLMLTESSWAHYFTAFREGLVEREAPDWRSDATDEEDSLVLSRSDGAKLVVIAGRQVVTSERLEVLALATAKQFEDGRSLRDAADMVASSGAVPVLPWGFGKWTGRRGRAMRDLLSSPLADRLYLGDNGGRPALAAEPRLFRVARARGIPVLPGSDPLPIPAEARKPGRYGFVLEGPVDTRSPAKSIRAMIARREPASTYGRLERLPTFLLRQTQIRLPGSKPGQATPSPRHVGARR